MRHNKKPTSKIAMASVLALVWLFVVWCCFEMHRLCDLSPLAYIGPAIIAMGAVTVGFYMWRAKQSDMVQIEMKRLETIAELKKKHGDDLPNEILSAMEYITND